MIWFTADLHLGCRKLVENTRPIFDSIEHHDRYIISMVNQNVGRNDILVIIGDFCQEKPGRYRPLIQCKNIFFVLGNHDKESKIQRVFGGNVWKERMVKLSNGQMVLCSHHPQCFWDKSHYGVMHAYGHTHYNEEREGMMNRGFPGRRSMDVGVDAEFALMGTYRPFSEKEISMLIGDNPGHDIIKPEDRWNARDYE